MDIFCIFLLFIATRNLALIDGLPEHFFKHFFTKLPASFEHIFNREGKNIKQQKEMVKKFVLENTGNEQMTATAAEIKNLLENSEQIYQLYPMNAESTKEDYQKLCRKLFMITHPDRQGGNKELSQRRMSKTGATYIKFIKEVSQWKMEIETNFDELKQKAMENCEDKTQQYDEEAFNLTKADKIVAIIKEFIVEKEKNNKLEEMIENPLNFDKKMEMELRKEKLGKKFRQNLVEFQQVLFNCLDNKFVLGKEVFEEMKTKLAVASVFLIGRCYAHKFVADYSREITKDPSSYVDAILKFHKFYGKHGGGIFRHIGWINENAKMEASKQIGQFYWDYLDFFNAKLLKIAEAMAKSKKIKVSQEIVNLLYSDKNEDDYVPKEIVRALFFKNPNLCPVKSDVKSEKPSEWTVFNVDKKMANAADENKNEEEKVKKSPIPLLLLTN